MKELLIIFEAETQELRNQLVDEIKKQGSWARLTGNSWCIKTDSRNTAEIRDNLKAVIGDSVARIFVVNMTDSAWASFAIPKEVTNWIKDNSWKNIRWIHLKKVFSLKVWYTFVHWHFEIWRFFTYGVSNNNSSYVQEVSKDKAIRYVLHQDCW